MSDPADVVMTHSPQPLPGTIGPSNERGTLEADCSDCGQPIYGLEGAEHWNHYPQQGDSQ